MTPGERVQETIARLNPKFDELADGYADFISADEGLKTTIDELSGGALH